MKSIKPLLLCAVFAVAESAWTSSTNVVHWTQDQFYLDPNVDSSNLTRGDGSCLYNFRRHGDDGFNFEAGRIFAYVPGQLFPAHDIAYVPPADANGFFESGAWVRNALGSPSLRTLSQRITQSQSGGRGSRIFFGISSSDLREILSRGGEAVEPEGAFFVAFPKEQFLEGASTQKVSFANSEGGNTVGYLLLRINNGRNSTIRFAILNDGKWYLSENSAKNMRRESFSIESHDILGSQWGEWNPTGGSDGQLAEAPDSYEVPGSAFTNIEAFGFYGRFRGEENSAPSFDFTEFLAAALVATPEE